MRSLQRFALAAFLAGTLSMALVGPVLAVPEQGQHGPALAYCSIVVNSPHPAPSQTPRPDAWCVTGLPPR